MRETKGQSVRHEARAVSETRGETTAAGVAIDDGVGVHIKDGAIADIVRAGAGDAYFVSGCSTGIDSQACDVTALKIGDEISFL